MLLEQGDTTAALGAARNALTYAASPRTERDGWWLSALIHQAVDDLPAARVAFEIAIQKARSADEVPTDLWRDLEAFETLSWSRGPLPARSIVAAMQGMERTVGVMPRLSLRIEFEFDSVELTEAGRAQVRELADALSDASMRSRAVRLIGHTDERGSIEYNQALSERRARAVFAEAVRLQPALRERIETEGRSELEPRIPDARTEAQHAVNRRVELVYRSAR